MNCDKSKTVRGTAGIYFIIIVIFKRDLECYSICVADGTCGELAVQPKSTSRSAFRAASFSK